MLYAPYARPKFRKVLDREVGINKNAKKWQVSGAILRAVVSLSFHILRVITTVHNNRGRAVRSSATPSKTPQRTPKPCFG